MRNAWKPRLQSDLSSVWARWRFGHCRVGRTAHGLGSVGGSVPDPTSTKRPLSASWPNPPDRTRPASVRVRAFATANLPGPLAFRDRSAPYRVVNRRRRSPPLGCVPPTRTARDKCCGRFCGVSGSGPGPTSNQRLAVCLPDLCSSGRLARMGPSWWAPRQAPRVPGSRPRRR